MWFSLDTPVSSNNKADSHDIAEILFFFSDLNLLDMKMTLKAVRLKLFFSVESGIKHHTPKPIPLSYNHDRNDLLMAYIVRLKCLF
jgi:hypothetical protein